MCLKFAEPMVNDFVFGYKIFRRVKNAYNDIVYFPVFENAAMLASIKNNVNISKHGPGFHALEKLEDTQELLVELIRTDFWAKSENLQVFEYVICKVILYENLWEGIMSGSPENLSKERHGYSGKKMVILSETNQTTIK